MRDILPEVLAWLAEGDSLALAVVLHTWGSAPRRAGSHMAIARSGRLAGSVSGGCVEAAVALAAERVLDSRRVERLSFGVADEQAWEVGLACGGQIEVLVFPAPESIPEFAIAVQRGEIAGYRVCVAGPTGTPGKLEGLRESDLPQRPEVRIIDGQTWFFNPLPAPPEIVAVGGGQITQALSRLVPAIGYSLLVIEPRRALAAAERFEPGTHIIPEWPAPALAQHPLKASSALLTLSHNPKLDDPALLLALASPAFYIGALGSRHTHSQRCQRLTELGVQPAVLARIHGPAGLSIDPASPEEIALSMLAEIVAMRNFQTNAENT